MAVHLNSDLHRWKIYNSEILKTLDLHSMTKETVVMESLKLFSSKSAPLMVCKTKVETTLIKKQLKALFQKLDKQEVSKFVTMLLASACIAVYMKDFPAAQANLDFLWKYHWDECEEWLPAVKEILRAPSPSKEIRVCSRQTPGRVNIMEWVDEAIVRVNAEQHPATSFESRARRTPGILSLENREGIIHLVGKDGTSYTPGRVIIDTGSNTTALCRNAVKRLNLKDCDLNDCPGFRTSTGVAGSGALCTKDPVGLEFGPKLPNNQRNCSLPLPSVTVTKSDDFDVLLGADFLSPMGFEISYRTEKVTYCEEQRNGSTLLRYLPVIFKVLKNFSAVAMSAMSAISDPEKFLRKIVGEDDRDTSNNKKNDTDANNQKDEGDAKSAYAPRIRSSGHLNRLKGGVLSLLITTASLLITTAKLNVVK